MAVEWWVLRDNEMSDRTYTKNELYRLEEFGPDTKVCRTNSNSWERARHDPALSTLFEDQKQVGPGEPSSRSGGNGKLSFVPRYSRLLAGVIDLFLIVVATVVVDGLNLSLDFSQSSLALTAFILGAAFYALFESDLLGSRTPGRSLFELSLVDIDSEHLDVRQVLGRYCFFGVPLLLLGVALDPSLPHDAITRGFSLVFGMIGTSVICINSYLFLFNNPTYRLLHDYASGVWVLPVSTEVIPTTGFLRVGQVLSVGLVACAGLAISFLGWKFFWDHKTPPPLAVPSNCSVNRDLRLLKDNPEVSPEHFRTLLLKRKFSQLEKDLTALKTAYEEARLNDAHLETAMSVFSVIDDRVGQRINEWVIRMPDSSMALLARAKYNLRQGAVQQQLYGQSLPDTRVDNAVRNHFQQARISVSKALRLDPELPVSYATMIKLNQFDKRTSSGKDLIERALDLEPPSVVVHRTLFLNNPDRQHNYLQSTGRHIPSESKLNLFCGIPAFRIANRFRKRGNYQVAEKYYRQSLRYGQSPWVFHHRAVNAGLRGNEKAAEKYFSRALALDPGRTNSLRRQAAFQFRRGLYSQSLDALSKALSREPDHPRLLHLYARVLNKIGKPARALEQLELAREFAPRWEPLSQLQSDIKRQEST